MARTLTVHPRFVGIVRDLHARAASAASGSPRWAVTEVSELGGGHSGFTYLLRTADEERNLVLRLSPPNARIVGPSDVGRQGRIMAAVAQAGVPVPRVLDCSSDPVIDGRAFVLMEWVDGTEWEASTLSHHDIAAQSAEMARRIGAVPAGASGIPDAAVLSPAAELQRWAALLPRCPDWLQAPAQALLARLTDSAPAAGAPGLVHGDFHYGNLMFNGGQITAVFDWEIASLGEPLFDLGSLVVASLRGKYAPEPNPTGSIDINLDELASLYGVAPSRLRWFAGASCFKYSAILGYNHELHRRGKRVDPIYDELLGTTRGLIDDANSLLKAT